MSGAGVVSTDQFIDGPSSAVDSNFVAFDGTSGKEIKDSGVSATTFLEVDNNLSDVSNISVSRSNIGLQIGADVQAWDVGLDDVAAISPATGTFIVGNGSGWIGESGSTARLSLGLGSISTQNSSDITITGGSISGVSLFGIEDLQVTDGGTGRSSHTAYAVVCGGTTNTAPQQSIAGVGSAGQVLTSNGAGGLPTFQAIPASGGFTWNVVTGTSQTLAAGNGYIANNASLVTFTLPATASVGDTFQIVGKGAGKWRLAQNAGQYIDYGKLTTTTGVGGRLDAEDDKDVAEFVCTATDVEFTTVSSIGNLTVV